MQAVSGNPVVEDKDKQALSKLAKNSILSGMGNVLVLGTVPITSLVTTRMLGAELFGVFSLVQSWCALLANISSLGLNGTNLRFVPGFKGGGDHARIKGSIFWTLQVSVILSIVFFLLIVIFPTEFCDIFVHRPPGMKAETFQAMVGTAFRFSAVSIVFTSVYLVGSSTLTGLQQVKYKILANEVWGSIAKIISLILLLALGLDLYAALGSNIVQDVIILGLSVLFVRKVFPQVADRTIRPVYERKAMNRFAAILFSNSILNKYTFQLDLLFLGYFQAANQLGIYTVALRLQSLIHMPMYSMMTIFSPMVAELHARNDRRKISDLYKTVTKWSLSLSLPIFGTLVIFSEHILNLFGKEFADGVLILAIMGFGNLFHALLGIAGQITTMTGRVGVNFYNSIVMSVVNVGLYFLLIPTYGMIGAAAGNALSNLLINLIMCIQVYVIYGLHPFKTSLYKPVLAFLIAALTAWTLSLIVSLPMIHYTFLAYVVLFWGVYLAVLFRLKIDDEDDYVLEKVSARLPAFLKAFVPRNQKRS